MECEHCKLILKSKYILKAHLSNNKSCLKKRGLEMESKYICSGCKSSFISNINLNIHHESCKSYQSLGYEIKLKDKDKEYESKLIQKDKECEIKIKEMSREHSKEISNHEKTIKDLQTQLDKMFSTIEKMALTAIDKPVTTVNVRNNNIYSGQYFLEKINPDEIKRKCQSYLTEQVFFDGQRGIAQLCTDHIIKTKDKKVLLTCSDVSRKKFKYVDENGNVKEDYEARAFTEKVYDPIKQVSKVVYEHILSDVKDEQERLDEYENIDYGRKSVLRDKTMRAINCFAQIVSIDDPNNNSEFKTELAILNK